MRDCGTEGRRGGTAGVAQVEDIRFRCCGDKCRQGRWFGHAQIKDRPYIGQNYNNNEKKC